MARGRQSRILSGQPEGMPGALLRADRGMGDSIAKPESDREGGIHGAGDSKE